MNWVAVALYQFWLLFGILISIKENGILTRRGAVIIPYYLNWSARTSSFNEINGITALIIFIFYFRDLYPAFQMPKAAYKVFKKQN